MLRRVHRNWGFYVDLLRTKKLCIKILVFNDNTSLSNQVHRFRTELWIPLLGWGVMLGEAWKILRFGSIYTIKPNQWHQFHAKSECIVLEIQYGVDIRETDIERAT